MSIEKYEVETDKETIEYVKKKAEFFIKHGIRKRNTEFEAYMSDTIFLINTKTGEVKRRVN